MTVTSGNVSAVIDAQRKEQLATLPSFCIILPMYNEQDGARECVLNIAEYLKSVPCRTAVIAVNDGSTDNTLSVLTELQKSVSCLKVESREVNGGYGGANRTGYQAAIREGFEYALVMDADGTQDPKFLKHFFPYMSRRVDFIKATRYAKGSKVVDVNVQRKLVSWVGNKLARIILRLPLSDYTNGFRAIKTDLLPHLATRERGFAMLIEEVSLAKKKGATFAEVPYTLTARSDNASKSKFVYSWAVYKSYLKYLFQM